jgi:tRNA dimethylallyltransferase
VALALGGEIVNADSRQIYRGMNIGTGMPSPKDLERVPHHLYAFLDPAERYSAARFVDDAGAAVRAIAARGRLPIIAGGTGFYIEALAGTMPLDHPPADDALRERLRDEARIHPPEVLRAWLATLSPRRASQIAVNDTYRVLRALEVELSARTQRPAQGIARQGRVPIHCDLVLLSVPRTILRDRIAARVHAMFDGGLVQEAQSVRAAAPNAPALSGLGYAEALGFIDGRATYAEAIDSTIRRTHAYAKRQDTWFRRLRCAHTIDARDPHAATDAVIALARETSPRS